MFHSQLLNTNCQRLPLEHLRRLEITGVRADRSNPTEAQIREFIKHYRPTAPSTATPSAAGSAATTATRPLDILWMLHQDDQTQNGPTIETLVKRLYKSGIRDIEPMNEPNGTWWKTPPMTARQMADRLLRAKGAAPSARIWGPSIDTWQPQAIEQVLERLGDYENVLEGITSHGYWSRIEDLPAQYLYSAQNWGLPYMISEVSFAGFPGQASYPVKIGQIEGLKQARSVMKKLPWVFYTGAEPANATGVGLFTWNGGGWEPSAVFEAVVTGVLA